MTDNKIIETWKKIQDILKKTENVVLQKEPIDDLVRHITNILDLINRQKAEIKKLREENKILSRYEDYIKAEAYKEFAERSEKEIFIKQDDERKQMLKILKTYRGTRTYSDTEQATDNWLRGYGEAVQDILCVFDNLLKEMVGDNNE